MKQGKISETILKRSILKNITYKKKQIIQGAGVGHDFSAIDLSGDNIITACDTCFYQDDDDIAVLVDKVCNNLLVSGGVAVAFMVQLILPVDVTEQEIKHVMQLLDENGRRRQVQIAGGNTMVSPHVSCMTVSVTGIGQIAQDKCWCARKLQADHEVVLCGCIARHMTKKLVLSHRKELLTRFSSGFLDQILVWEKLTDITPMIQVCRRAGVSAVHDLSDSGIFGGLWELACAGGLGIEARVSDILIRQETVELCEFFQCNPYELPSVGNILAVTQDSGVLINMLEQEGIRAAMIGHLIQGNDKYVICHEEKRFLTPPGTVTAG